MIIDGNIGIVDVSKGLVREVIATKILPERPLFYKVFVDKDKSSVYQIFMHTDIDGVGTFCVEWDRDQTAATVHYFP